MFRRNVLVAVPWVISSFVLGGSAAYAAGPQGSVKIDPANTFATQTASGDVLCGLVKGRWVPGKLVGRKKDMFLTHSAAVRNMKQSARSLSGSKFTKMQKKIKKLAGLNKAGKTACAGGPQTPQETPSATPTPGTTPVLFEMTRAVTQDDVNHLYRRAGLGVVPAGAQALVGKPVSELVTFFLTYVPEQAVEDEARIWLDEDPAPPNYPNATASVNGYQLYALRILSKTKNPFHEQLALIALHDRLSTSTEAINPVNSQHYLYLLHLNRLRQAARDGDYEKLVEDIGEDPTMVKWLSLDKNTRTGPNENYAREVMELFSLDTKNSAGEDNYTNQDIAEIARAFTGWNVLQPPLGGGAWSSIFTTLSFDPNSKNIFQGTPYAATVSNGRDVVRHIFLNHPNAPISFAKWMTRHYLRADASDAILNELAVAIKASNYDMRPVFQLLFRSEEFYKPENQLTIAKTPSERVSNLLRVMDSVNMPYDFRNRRAAVEALGCMITHPDTVFGCIRMKELPDGQRSLNSANLVTSLSNDNTTFNTAGFSYANFFPVPNPTADQLITRFEQLFGITLRGNQRTALLEYLNYTRNNNATLTPSAWDPTNTTQVRNRVSGLFRIFATLPQVHDLK